MIMSALIAAMKWVGTMKSKTNLVSRFPFSVTSTLFRVLRFLFSPSTLTCMPDTTFPDLRSRDIPFPVSRFRTTFIPFPVLRFPFSPSIRIEFHQEKMRRNETVYRIKGNNRIKNLEKRR